MSIPGSQHQQYSLIVALSKKLCKMLVGGVVTECYTLSKDECVMVFQLASGNWCTLKIVQQYQSCFILFETARPEKISNAQPCLESIIGQPIRSITQHPGNRSFGMQFDGSQQLVFKLYDALVNLLVFNNGKVTDVFRDRIAKDWELTPASFIPAHQTMAETADHFYIYKRTHQHPFYLALSKQPDTLVFESDDVLLALTEFSRLCLNHYRFAAAKHQLLATYTTERIRLEGLLSKTKQGLQRKQSEATAEEIANLIMANLHIIPPRCKQVELFDFYRNKQLVVALKEDLNAQQNAAYYYRKHKNGTIEQAQLQQRVKTSEDRLVVINGLIQAIERAQQYRELKPYLPKEKEQKQVALPFRQFESDGFLIWVGKSAAGNDDLTMRHSHKNDLWLHAKDVTGSHVLVKWKAGKEFTKKAIERAAQLAAYYSKLKGSGLVPVTYTLKKFVRKPKGAEPGSVVVDKEEVVMVEPKLEA